MKVLIVDDELWSRQLIKKVVDWHEFGFDELFEASNGNQAIKILEKTQIDLVVTDMRMPGSDGAMLLQYLRQESYFAEVIVMSGYEDYKYLHEALKTKAVDYLLKPIVKSELIQAIKRAIDFIAENKSYEHIEEILRNEDLKYPLNTYYEMKNILYKSLITADEVKLMNQLNRLDNLLKEYHLNNRLVSFVFTDIQRFLLRLSIEYTKSDEEVNHEYSDFQDIKDQILKMMQVMIDTKIQKKISVLDVQKYIDHHFTEGITLSDLADVYHVSKEHLSRQFKKDVHMTVQNYITNKKIDYAKRMLVKYPTLSISTVSVMSGYMDIQYFYRVFKGKTKLTPNEYRNKTSI